MIIKKITKLRLLYRQIKNDAELEADIQIAAIERGIPQTIGIGRSTLLPD